MLWTAQLCLILSFYVQLHDNQISFVAHPNRFLHTYVYKSQGVKQ